MGIVLMNGHSATGKKNVLQCCHNQPLIDKIITILFTSKDDFIQVVSQMFISDKAQQGSSHSNLNYITHKKINCLSNQSYIIILVDLGLPKSTFSAEWFSTDPNGVSSLQIYAAGINLITFPFIKGHPDIADTLCYLPCY